MKKLFFDFITVYSDEISSTFNLPITVAFNIKRGYYFRINLNKTQISKNSVEINDHELNNLVHKLKQQSKQFIKITKISKSVHFTTKRILQLNERIKECQNDIYIMSNRYS